MEVVLDTSAALALSLPDERHEVSEDLGRSIHDCTLIVPRLWHYEIANALLDSLRRGRIQEEELPPILAALRQLNARTLDGSLDIAQLLALARTAGISAYDASYLEIAVSRGTALATLDKKLRNADKAANVTLIPPMNET